MNPWFLLATVLAVGAACGGAYWQGRQDGKAVCQAEHNRDQEVAAIAGEAAASAAAHAISKIEVKHVTLRQRLETEVREIPVYRDCRHSPDGLRRLNEALATGSQPEPPGGGQLPAASAPHR